MELTLSQSKIEKIPQTVYVWGSLNMPGEYFLKRYISYIFEVDTARTDSVQILKKSEHSNGISLKIVKPDVITVRCRVEVRETADPDDPVIDYVESDLELIYGVVTTENFNFDENLVKSDGSFVYDDMIVTIDKNIVAPLTVTASVSDTNMTTFKHYVGFKLSPSGGVPPYKTSVDIKASGDIIEEITTKDNVSCILVNNPGELWVSYMVTDGIGNTVANTIKIPISKRMVHYDVDKMSEIFSVFYNMGKFDDGVSILNDELKKVFSESKFTKYLVEYFCSELRFGDNVDLLCEMFSKGSIKINMVETSHSRYGLLVNFYKHSSISMEMAADLIFRSICDIIKKDKRILYNVLTKPADLVYYCKLASYDTTPIIQTIHSIYAAYEKSETTYEMIQQQTHIELMSKLSSPDSIGGKVGVLPNILR